jgi:hypothetical protein
MHLNNQNLIINKLKDSCIHTGKLCNASGTTIINLCIALSEVGDDPCSPVCSTDDRRLI